MTDHDQGPPTEPGAWIHAALARHERSLVAYARRITGDAERAGDAVQETFLELCRATRVEVEARLQEWLFTVCRNRALGVRRRESRIQPALEVALVHEPAAELRPDEVLERRETAQAVFASFAHLPASQQEVLQLKFQHGFSYKEISRVTGHSVTNVGYLLHVGLRALRERHAPGSSQGVQGGVAS